MTRLERLRMQEVVRPRSTTQFVPFVEVDEDAFNDLLAVAEAAQAVHRSLRVEFRHNLAMRDLGKALRPLAAELAE